MMSIRPSVFARRTAAAAVFTLVGSLALHAQQTATVGTTSTPANTQIAFATAPDFNLAHLASSSGVDYAASSASSSSSSSSAPADGSSSSSEGAAADTSVDAARWNLTDVPSNALQPPPRRTYGRPRYNDNSHNADGSSKLAFEASVGFTTPLTDLSNYDATSFAFGVGGGRRFNKKFATFIQFDWDNFGLQQSTLNNEFTIYNTVFGSGAVSSLSGNAHIWSLTIDPTYNFISGDKYGAYVVGGVGYYHKVTTFTTPTEEVVDTYFGVEAFDVNANFDHYTSNAFGANGGVGFTYKPSKFANEQIFAEVRAVYVNNQARTGVTIGNLNSTSTANYVNGGGTNFYPANGDTSLYLPIKFGLRF